MLQPLNYCHKKKGINENAESWAFNLGHDRSELLNSIAKRLAASVNVIGTSDELLRIEIKHN